MKRIKSFAKINLGLEVISKREDGYHNIKTIFQTIDFYDVLKFKTIDQERIVLRGNHKSIAWDESNLIFKAAALLRQEFRPSSGIEIWVEKNIPPGAGLGGGSANAAMTLLGLDAIWGLHLEKKALVDMGRMLGADVPFFLEGGACLGVGRGDEIIPLPDLPHHFCVLALPSFSISTASVYSRFPSFLTSDNKESKIDRFLEERRIGILENQLEEIVFSSYPLLKAIKHIFQSQGAELSLVSGTGAGVFGLFRERERAEKALEEIKRNHRALVVETLSREQYRKSSYFGV
ncbi:MAG: 4-(cytidine 5'-diphospho)-2-C-methyl-D-erythritol kinase [Candidatus Aminicenantes bacterium]